MTRRQKGIIKQIWKEKEYKIERTPRTVTPLPGVQASPPACWNFFSEHKVYKVMVNINDITRAFYQMSKKSMGDLIEGWLLFIIHGIAVLESI